MIREPARGAAKLRFEYFRKHSHAFPMEHRSPYLPSRGTIATRVFLGDPANASSNRP